MRKKEVIDVEKVEIDQVEFGKRLHDVRTAKKVSQKTMAVATGLGPNYLSSIERGLYKCSANTLITYAKVLDMSIDEIVGFEPSSNILSELKELIIGMDKETQEKVIQMIKIWVPTAHPEGNKKE